MGSVLTSVLVTVAAGGIVYVGSGDADLAALSAIIAYLLFRMDETRRAQEQRIAALERRLLGVEEGKASSAWVARIDESREQDRHYLDRQIDDLRARRFERSS